MIDVLNLSLLLDGTDLQARGILLKNTFGVVLQAMSATVRKRQRTATTYLPEGLGRVLASETLENPFSAGMIPNKSCIMSGHACGPLQRLKYQ